MKHASWLFLLCLAGCSSMHPGRVFVDSTTHSDSPPNWARSLKKTWEEDSKIFTRATHTVRGDERVNGCFDLAKLDSKEALLSEIATDIRGSLDNAQTSISENAETVLGKVRSGEFQGRLTGLRFTEEYFERYRIGEIERIDCHVLGEMKISDYNQVKRAVIDKVIAVDPRVKEAITNKQVDFFRKPAGEPASAAAPAPETEAQ